jgi:hypothetical protein
MTRRTKQETLDLYTRTLSTMTAVIDDLRDEPDPDGALTELANRIETERQWVRTLLALGEEPIQLPPKVLRRAPLDVMA